MTSNDHCLSYSAALLLPFKSYMLLLLLLHVLHKALRCTASSSAPTQPS
jgi:hypothetical protein